ncbi:MAG: hypothetical protein VB835_20670 [Pirellulales bacterium]
MNTLQHFWNDTNGYICTTDLILISAILVIGAMVGLVTLRDQVTQEFGDLAVAIGNLNQSYSFSGATVGGFTVEGSDFVDMSDDCEVGVGEGTAGSDPAGAAPACIDICGVAASPELP